MIYSRYDRLQVFREHTALSGMLALRNYPCKLQHNNMRQSQAHLTDSTTSSAQSNHDAKEQVAVKKITNVFSKDILAKRALREIKLLEHFRGMTTLCICCSSYMLTDCRSPKRTLHHPLERTSMIQRTRILKELL